MATQMKTLSAKMKTEYISLGKVWDLSKVHEMICALGWSAERL